MGQRRSWLLEVEGAAEGISCVEASGVGVRVAAWDWEDAKECPGIANERPDLPASDIYRKAQH